MVIPERQLSTELRAVAVQDVVVPLVRKELGVFKRITEVHAVDVEPAEYSSGLVFISPFPFEEQNPDVVGWSHFNLPL